MKQTPGISMKPVEGVKHEAEFSMIINGQSLHAETEVVRKLFGSLLHPKSGISQFNLNSTQKGPNSGNRTCNLLNDDRLPTAEITEE